jgi:hypothetical protein
MQSHTQGEKERGHMPVPVVVVASSWRRCVSWRCGVTDDPPDSYGRGKAPPGSSRFSFGFGFGFGFWLLICRGRDSEASEGCRPGWEGRRGSEERGRGEGMREGENWEAGGAGGDETSPVWRRG